MKTIGDRLRRTRTEQGLSLRQLADKSGVFFTTVGNIEIRGDGMFRNVAALAAALGLSLDWLAAPAQCAACDDHPPAGFTCNECGREGQRLAGDQHGAHGAAAGR